MSEEVVNLPSFYKQLEYLESDGSQWINTGIIPNNETGAYVKALQTVTGNTFPIGAYSYASGNNGWIPMRLLMKGNTNYPTYRWGTSWFDLSNSYNDNITYISKTNWLNSKIVELLNENEPIIGPRDLNPSTVIDPLCEATLFAVNASNNSRILNWKGRIYRIKISQGSEIVRDFVPAFNRITNKPCMFDLVTQTAYYNNGTGEFSYEYEEPIISIPYGYKRCTFLESTGTQYIDTQIAATSSHGLWAEVLGTSSEDRNIFGCSHIETVDGVEQITSLTLPKNNSTHSYCYGLSQGNFAEDSTYYNKRYTKFTNYLNSKLASLQTLNSVNTSALSEEEFELESNIFLFTNNETIRNEDGTISSTMGPMVGGIISNTFIGKIYRAKITHEGNVIADFIPCLDTDGRPCMYDVVRQQTFYNANDEGYDFSYQVENRLPRRYKRLQWLESTGTQYLLIDEPFILTGDSLSSSGVEIYAQTTNTATSGGYCTWGFSTKNVSWSVGGEMHLSIQFFKSSLNIGFGGKTSISLSLPGDYANYNFMGCKTWKVVSGDTEKSSQNMIETWKIKTTKGFNQQPLFARINEISGKVEYLDKIRISRCKMSQGTKLTRHLIPAYDTEEQRPCMYDLIDGRAYYNAGTGEFNYPSVSQETNYTGFCQLGVIGNRLGTGKDDIPYEYTPISYLESTGTQWLEIDEPFYDNTTGIYTKFAKSSEFKSRFLWFQRSIDKNWANTSFGANWIGASYMNYGEDKTNLAVCENDGWLLFLNTPVGTPVEVFYRFESTTSAKIIGLSESKEQNNLRDRGKNTETDTQLIFARKLSHNSPVQPYAGFRLYSFKISQNLKVTRDLVPCLDSTGRPCMFDKISRKTFYNQGTGEFLYG